MASARCWIAVEIPGGAGLRWKLRQPEPRTGSPPCPDLPASWNVARPRHANHDQTTGPPRRMAGPGRAGRDLDRARVGVGSRRTSPARTAQASAERGSAFFEASVRPVLVEQCLKCHGPTKQSGGLRLDSRASILEGGDAGPAVVARRARQEPAGPGGPAPGRPQDAAQGEAARPGRRVAGELGQDGRPLALRPGPLGRGQGRRRPEALVVPAGRRPRPAEGRALRPGGLAGRRLHPREAGGEEARTVAPGRQADPDPPGHLRPDRPAADARRGRRLPRATSPPRRSRRSSTACSPRPATASAGAGTGSTSPAMPTPRGTSSPPRSAIPTRTPIAIT